MMRCWDSAPFSFGYSNVPKDNWERTFGADRGAASDLKPKLKPAVGWQMSQIVGFTLLDPLHFRQVTKVEEGDWIFWATAHTHDEIVLQAARQVKEVFVRPGEVLLIFEEDAEATFRRDELVLCSPFRLQTAQLPLTLRSASRISR
jgi:hypothetical protein